MKALAVLATGGLMVLGATGFAQAQVSGTPNSPFPYAAPNEVQIVNGVPCRTVLDHGTNQRIPIQCAGSAGVIGLEPEATGSIMMAPPPGVPGAPVSGTPASPFPNAAPHEIRWINGVPCRTMLVPGTETRVPVECAAR